MTTWEELKKLVEEKAKEYNIQQGQVMDFLYDYIGDGEIAISLKTAVKKEWE